MFDRSFLVGVLHFSAVALILKILGCVLPCCLTGYYSCLANTLLFLYVAKTTLGISKRKFLSDRITPENRAVLITGCDSGFGHELAKRLDSKGFPVFASCLNADGKGAEKLKASCSQRLQVLELNVTKDESVKKALEFVKENLGSCELWAVVNNAGIQKGLDAELSSMKDFKETMEVNAFGLVRVTKAFLPLLRQSRGRVVNVTSLSGRLTCPHLCPYTMSKFAAVAFTECLKQEMEVWGVRVISIEPEIFATPLTSPKTVLPRIEDSFRDIEQDVREDYGEKYFTGLMASAEFSVSLASSKINKVIDDLESAVSLEYPDYVYNPSRNFVIKIFWDILKCMPRSVVDALVRLYTSVTGFPKPKEAENNL